MKLLAPATVNDPGEWDAFIGRAPAATVFHTSAWLDSSPRSFIKLGVRSAGGSLVGGCVLEGPIRPTDSKTVTPYQGPLFATGSMSLPRRLAVQWGILESLEATLLPFANAHYFSSPWLDDLRPFVSRGWQVELRYTHNLALVGAEALWKGFETRLRTSIRNAQRSRLRIIHRLEPDRMDVDLVIGLSAQSFERHGTPILYDSGEARACLATLARSGKAEILVAESADRPIAAIALVGTGKRAHYLLGGYDNERAPPGSVSLLLWEASCSIPERGYELLDFEGSHVPAIDHFFRSFGTSLVPFYEVSHPHLRRRR